METSVNLRLCAHLKDTHNTVPTDSFRVNTSLALAEIPVCCCFLKTLGIKIFMYNKKI